MSQHKLVLVFILIFSAGAFGFTFNHSNPRDLRNWNTYAIVGDAGKRNITTDALRKTLESAGMLQLILPGDNNYSNGTYSAIWGLWKNRGFQFPLVAIGNHNTGYANEVAYFQTPGEYYSYESKGALFLVLNSDNEYNYREQINWLDQALSSSQYPLIFLVYHHPTVTLSSSHDWPEKRGFQWGMRSIIKKHAQKITALIVGHDHSAGLFLLDSTPLILSGASWESREMTLPPPRDKDFKVQGLWATIEGGLWWTKLDYNALTKEVYVHYNRFDKNQEACTFKLSPKPISKTRSCR